MGTFTCGTINTFSYCNSDYLYNVILFSLKQRSEYFSTTVEYNIKFSIWRVMLHIDVWSLHASGHSHTKQNTRCTHYVLIYSIHYMFSYRWLYFDLLLPVFIELCHGNRETNVITHLLID